LFANIIIEFSNCKPDGNRFKKKTLRDSDVIEIQIVAEQAVCRILVFTETSGPENPKPNTVNLWSPAGNKFTAVGDLAMRESKETTPEAEATMLCAVTIVLELWPAPVEILQLTVLVDDHLVFRQEVKCSRTCMLP